MLQNKDIIIYDRLKKLKRLGRDLDSIEKNPTDRFKLRFYKFWGFTRSTRQNKMTRLR